MKIEPRREKPGLRGFRPGPTQIGLYSNRRWTEARNFVLRKKRDCTGYVAKKGADQLRGSASLLSHLQRAGFLMTRLIKILIEQIANRV